MRKIKEQMTQSVYSTTRYWNHAESRGYRKADGELMENDKANPDNLDEAMSLYSIKEADKEVQDRVRKLMDIAKQILTQQQYNVFILLAVKDPALTEREAAKALSITRGRVHQLWAIARAKMEKAYNERTA